MPNGVLISVNIISSNRTRQGEIRRASIEADLVDNMVALSDSLTTASNSPTASGFLRKTNTMADTVTAVDSINPYRN